MRDRRLFLSVGVLLALLTFGAFRDVAFNSFIGYDDTGYLTKNPMVRQGLTLPAAVWAFTTTHQANWHPLTWLSHMLDVQLFGMNPGAHHLVSLAIHVAGALLLLTALRGLTGALWPSVLVAALFAVHPLHVESVAWAAERKDVLSTLFALAALLAYVRAVRRDAVLRSAALPLLFALALLAKPMPLSLPFLLLLLDWWPLGRWTPGAHPLPPARLWFEKLPLFLLTGASAAVTLLAQARGGAMAPIEILPFAARWTNALVSYVRYLGATLRPVDLVLFYPLPDAAAPWWLWGGALLLLAAVTALVLRVVKSQPWLAVGWFWYLGSLVPVIGLVQVGVQAMADRYTYLPLTGIFIAVAWSLARVAGRYQWLRWPLAAGTVCCVIGCAALTGQQVDLWRDDITLFTHAVQAAEPTWVALAALGDASEHAGDHASALAYYQRALAQRPQSPNLLNNIGNVLLMLGRDDEAEAWYRDAIVARPDSPVAHYNLAKILQAQGLLEEAEMHYRATLRVNPLFLPAHANLGAVLAAEGRREEAAAEFHRALELDPNQETAREGLRALGSPAP